ncbi:LysR family transcriptional regulator [Actibacterium pelagium]|uniref:LysR family transcriptional regulator n=1 Tax=Actibacterium pelagium TaxID=2029103 RepID=A0A917AHW2_9RHOB|nr:LysR family transcriptional regulator [Actibacterium pelagium]GGE54327.1 LysR family transcriptional regulator [Actibacterium pelagium]
MDLIDGLRAFVATAQTGSFTEAASQLGISNRLTSKYVGELEVRLGTRLFQRTTRKVGLTPAGESLLARAPALLDSLDDILADMTEESRGFSGVLRVSAPVTFGELYITGMLGRFAASHPDLTIDLQLDDRYVDLAAGGIDVAFRLGRSDVLSLKSRKLGEVRSVVAASPDYLAKHGAPVTPNDLAKHAGIIDNNRRDLRKLSFWKDDKEDRISLSGRFSVNSARAASELAVAGHGVVFSPAFALQDHLAAGRLTELLTDYASETIRVNAVYLEGHDLPRKTRALIDFAVTDFRARSAEF